jgi:hypothetical protein
MVPYDIGCTGQLRGHGMSVESQERAFGRMQEGVIKGFHVLASTGRITPPNIVIYAMSASAPKLQSLEKVIEDQRDELSESQNSLTRVNIASLPFRNSCADAILQVPAVISTGALSRL